MIHGRRRYRPVEVHAWLDVACPWCWIAKRRFEAAEIEFGGDVALEYHSFELAPDLPADYVTARPTSSSSCTRERRARRRSR